MVPKLVTVSPNGPGEADACIASDDCSVIRDCSGRAGDFNPRVGTADQRRNADPRAVNDRAARRGECHNCADWRSTPFR